MQVELPLTEPTPTHKHSIECADNPLRILIQPRTRIMAVMFFILTAYALAFLALSALFVLILPGKAGPVVAIGMFILTALLISYTICCWYLAEKGMFIQQTIEVTDSAVVIWRGESSGIKVLARRGRPKKYSVEFIRNLRPSLAGSQGSIAFDYGEAPVRFAAGISKAEAEQVVAEILSRLPQLAIPSSCHPSP